MPMVTDPALLAVLNSGGASAPPPSSPPGQRMVTDPALLAALNGPTDTEAYQYVPPSQQQDISAGPNASGSVTRAMGDAYYGTPAILTDDTQKAINNYSPTLGAISKALSNAPGTFASLYRGAQQAAINAGVPKDVASLLDAFAGSPRAIGEAGADVVQAARAQNALPAIASTSPGIVKGIADRIMASKLPEDTDPDSQASSIRVAGQLQDAQQNASVASGTPVPLTAAANSVKTNLLSDLQGAGKALNDGGHITDAQLLEYKLATDSALRANNTLDTTAGSPFAGINDWNVPQNIQDALQQRLRDLNTVSTQSFQNRTTGPFQTVGSAIGRVVPAGAAMVSGHPTLAVEALTGSPLTAKIGGAIGGAMDRRFGLDTPTVMLQAQNAARQLRAVGINPDAIQQTPLPPMPGAPPPPPVGPYGAAGRAPTFIRPAVPTPPAITPYGTVGNTPPPPVFKAPAPPPAPSVGPYGNAGTTPPAVALMASQRAAGMRALAEQQALTGGIGQPDPATGLPSSAIPPNVPIRSSVPTPPAITAPSTLPPLRVDTPQTIQVALEQDGMAKATPALTVTPPTPGQNYATLGGFARDPAHATQLANDAARAGILTPQEATQIATGIAPLTPATAAKFRAFGTAQGSSDAGLDPAAAPVTGPYDVAARKAVQMNTYQKSADILAGDTTTPGQRAALAAIRDEPLTANKTAIADQLSAADASVAQMMAANQWLLKGGK